MTTSNNIHSFQKSLIIITSNNYNNIHFFKKLMITSNWQ